MIPRASAAMSSGEKKAMYGLRKAFNKKIQVEKKKICTNLIT